MARGREQVTSPARRAVPRAPSARPGGGGQIHRLQRLAIFGAISFAKKNGSNAWYKFGTRLLEKTRFMSVQVESGNFSVLSRSLVNNLYQGLEPFFLH